MSEAEVYFASATSYFPWQNMRISLERLFELLDVREWISKETFTRPGIRFLAGAAESTRYLRPILVRTMVDEFLKLRAIPIAIDSESLWKGGARYDAAGWSYKCRQHGFSMESLGTEIFLAEGYTGMDSKTFMNKKANKIRVLEVGATITYCQLLMMLTHVTGDPFVGFYGAIADMALGCTAKRGKMRVFEDFQPRVNMETCNMCGLCQRICEWDAIKINETVSINPNKCVGCGKCIVKCPQLALEVSPDQVVDLQTKIADAASFVIQAMDGKIVYYNFIIDVTPNPDIDPNSGIPFIPDLGILASRDAVAIDKATYDLVNRVPGVPGSIAEQFNVLEKGAEKFKAIAVCGADPMVQIKAAETLGLGTTNYKLIDVWDISENG
ncbi:MAG: DUF362 domain-containing protein [Promethearchaeota archaeon]